MSLGYEVDCKLLNKDLSVPSGLFLLNKSVNLKSNKMDDILEDLDHEDVVDDRLYNNLLELMNPKPIKKQRQKKKTRRTRGKRTKRKGNRKTKSKRNWLILIVIICIVMVKTLKTYKVKKSRGNGP